MSTNIEWNEGFEIFQDEDNRKRSLLDLADDCERRAAEDEAIVLKIMSNADESPDEVRREQLRFATLIAEESRKLRDDAKRVRQSVAQQIPILTRSA
jgi:hypothetical protein